MIVAALCLAAGCAYLLAGRRPLRLYGARRGWTVRRWRAMAFVTSLGLVATVAGLGEVVAAPRFWLRTSQLMLLLMVACPLLVLGAPSARFARLFNRPGQRAMPRRSRSVAAFLLFSVALVAAYLPPVYRLTGTSNLARQIAQLTIVVAGYAFWTQVITQPGRPSPLSHLGRVAYLFLSSAQVRILGLVLGFAPASFYGVPLIDQQIGAGILMVPGVLTDLIALTVCLYLWLAQDDRRNQPRWARIA
jgi:cytochrome c oxidase assembly factor CtaG